MKSTEYGKLVEFVETEATISCTAKNCKSVVVGYGEYDVSRDAYDKGWRATHSNVYCPSCAKKKLKK